MFKALSRIETDIARNLQMHERRVKSLEFLKGELNPNAY